MKTFMEWLADPSPSMKERLEAAVKEYLVKKPGAQKCYYITRPKNMHFDPNNPKHVEDELGTDYDKSLGVVPFKHHPLSFTCVNAADDLAKFLREKGFKARKVAGWYGTPEPGYHAGYAIGLNDANPPKGHNMKSPQQHWWVEAEGHYIDITSAQFHPTTPQDQQDLVIKDKHDAFTSGKYHPARRFPLGRSVPLPPNIQRMVDKISSLKKFGQGHSANPSDNQNLSEWMEKNAKKYGLSESRLHDVIAALKAHNKPGFHFADKRAMERLFGEAFDDIEEDKSLDAKPNEFKPEPKKTSRGVVRFSRSSVTISSTYPDDLEDNFYKLKELVRLRRPDADFGDAKKYSEKGGYGGTVHYITASLKDSQEIMSDRDLMDDLRKEKFKTG
jgi:hypothetical protein